MKTGPVSIHPGLVAVVLISATSAWLLAQQEIPQPLAIFRSTADVVRVEASVLDKDRRPVRGLQAGDFSVLENGHERPVVAFAPVELPPAAPAAIAGAAWLQDAPRDVVGNGGADAGRLVVIAFDWSIRFYDQAARAADRARRRRWARPDGRGGRAFHQAQRRRRQAARVHRGSLAVARRDQSAVCRRAYPARLEAIIDPDGYDTSGECLCGMCTLEALTRTGTHVAHRVATAEGRAVHRHLRPHLRRDAGNQAGGETGNHHGRLFDNSGIDRLSRRVCAMPAGRSSARWAKPT